ncbi:sphingolipid 4-desaturase/C4-monooxygenase, partial [Phenoliferia sp. Uapishka_3]
MSSLSEWAPSKPGLPSGDFLWVETEEVHRARRKAIMKAHPEVKSLMGREPLTIPLVLFVASTQLYLAYSLRHVPVFSLRFLLTAYVIGGTFNQNTFLSIHDITHNLVFKSSIANRWFAIFANLPIGLPFAMMFKKYHEEHHRFFGEDGYDTDLPTSLELHLLKSPLGKLFFLTFQIFFYALRPTIVRQIPFTKWIALNIFVQLAFDALVVHFLGWHPLIYFLFSSFFAGSLHPLAGHFIAEHYLFDGYDQETWSYYGPLNILVYNVRFSFTYGLSSLNPASHQTGYHNEHHDFPSVPWTRLPALNALAPEFYMNIPYHTSWPGVLWRFLTDGEVGIWSRKKRMHKIRRE